MLLLAVAACPAQQLQLNTRPVPLGVFTEVQDIATTLPGFAELRPAQDSYRLGGAGASITGRSDGLRFASVRRSGPFSLSADLHLDAPVANAEAAGMLLVRQGLEPQAPFAAIAYQANGQALFLVRQHVGAIVQSTLLGTGKLNHLALTRNGDHVDVSFSNASGESHERAFHLPPFTDPVYVGIGVSAHNPYALQSATFSHLHLTLATALPLVPASLTSATP